MMPNNNLIERLTKDLKDFIEKEEVLKSNMYGVYLFGSTARKEQQQSEHSDIDLLIIANNNQTNIDFFTKLSRSIKELGNLSQHNIEIAYLTKEELPLMVSPVLAKSWSAEGICIYGKDLEILKTLITDQVDKLHLYKSVIRRQQFNFYMLRQTFIADLDNATEEVRGKITRSIAKQIVWAKRATMYLENKEAFKYTYGEIIELIKEDDAVIAGILMETIIKGKNNQTDLDILFLYLKTKNEENVNRLINILKTNGVNSQSTYVLDPL